MYPLLFVLSPIYNKMSLGILNIFIEVHKTAQICMQASRNLDIAHVEFEGEFDR